MAKKLAVIVGLTLCLVGMRAFEAGDRGAVRREAASAWTKLGPVGGDIAGLAASSVTPGELYAVSSLGLVFRSTTNGASWTQTAALKEAWDRGACDIQVDAKTASTIYVLVKGDERYGAPAVLCRSKDKGATFASFPFGSSASIPEGNLAVHLVSPSVVYWGGSWGGSSSQEKQGIGVFKSVNGGKTWSRSKLLEGFLYKCRIAMSPANPATIYFCAEYTPSDWSDIAVAVFVSLDAGRSWKDITPDFLGDPGPCNLLHDLCADPADPGKIYVCAGSDRSTYDWSGVAQTSDFGATWTRSRGPRTNFQANSLAIDEDRPGTLYATALEPRENPNRPPNAFYVSGDGGQTFEFKTLIRGESHRILASGGAILCASAAGVFKSLDGGLSFSPWATGLLATEVGSLAFVPVPSARTAPPATGALYAAADEWGCFKSVNGGRTWTALAEFSGGIHVYDLAVPKADAGRIYASIYPPWYRGETGEYEGLYRSSDGGQSFQVLRLLDCVVKLGVDPRNPNRVIGAGWVGYMGAFVVSLSTDGGATWTLVKIRDSSSFYDVAGVPVVSPSNANTIYLPGRIQDGGRFLYKTTDGGLHWNPVTCPPDLDAVAVAPGSSNTLYAVGNAAGGCVFKSTTGGKSWKKLKGSPYGSRIVINPSNSKDIFVVWEGECSYSADGGVTWKALGEGLPSLPCLSTAIDPASRKIYVGTRGGGVYSRKF